MSEVTAVSFISLGCAKNQINTEIMIAAVKNAGYDITGEPEKSKVCVINTCGFIEDAKKEALETFFEVAELKKEKKLEKIIVCGCLAQRYEKEIAEELYEADGFVGVGSFSRIAEAVEKVLDGERVMFFDDLSNIQLEGERFVISPPFSTYLKIADGCSNRCSYCAIPIIRGGFRSRPMENIIAEAEKLAQNGAKEIVVIAQDTTNYGIDIYGSRKLPQLLERLCQIDSVEWIRIMYLYPEKITRELIDVIKTQPKIVKYIEMPIQHASGKVLKSMNRPQNSQILLELVNRLRSEIPGVVLRTTVMVGFPGETQQDFEELCTFLKAARFDKLGVFQFSAETGTPAYDMPGRVDEDVSKSRAETVELIQSQIVLEKQRSLIGKSLTVMCEGFDRFAEYYFGRSYMEAPDIDGKIFFKSDDVICLGDMCRVRITESMDFELIGEIEK